MSEKLIFLKMAQLGMPLKNELVIDCHTHIGPFCDFHITWNNVDGMIEHMDRLGISKAGLMSFAGLMSDYVLGNNLVVDAVHRCPERFIGFTIVNPNYPDDIIPELERCRALGLLHIKLIVQYQNCTADDPNLIRVFEYADKKRYIILGHNLGSEEFLYKIALEFKNAVFIDGHFCRQHFPLIKKTENVFICTCSPNIFGCIEEAVNEFGADRLLFGSDMLYLDGALGLGGILCARISDEDKREILGLNMRNLLERGKVDE